MLVALFALNLPQRAQGQQTEVVYLSGIDKDQTVDWEFFVTGGSNSGTWTTIPVPSHWEFHGFGVYNYGHDEPKGDEEGRYRYRFDVPEEWRGRNVQIVFEGAMTDTDVRINGASAGPTHQGGFYQFRYDVTNLLEYGAENLLEADVRKMSADESVNVAEREADYWVFGGIYRPVYLEARPQESIQRTALDARADGSFSIDVYLNDVDRSSAVQVQIEDLDGTPVGAAVTEEVGPGQEHVTLRTRVEDPHLWTPEHPNRYQVSVELREGDAVVHGVRERFGFRTVELRPRDGIYINGVKVHLKGVNRHVSWPDAGRASSREISEMDINLIKDMNMNAVRTSHYPPDQHFLDVADSLGLFVLLEIAGWQAPYDTPVAEKLVREMVTRDVNHPSVIFWNNGNEGGFNYDIIDDYWFYDPQQRPVMHPWQFQEGRINMTHYKTYDCCANRFFYGHDVFVPTEFLHGMYDGGHGAGLNDMWNRMLMNPLAAGAFLWVFADEGIVRVDEGGRIDTDGNHAPDGIFGPYREKEGSFFAIKEIWSPVFFELSRQELLPPGFDGALRVENRFYYTNLAEVDFAYQLVDFPSPDAAVAGHSVAQRGAATPPTVEPWQRGTLQLDLPENWRSHDALYLTATDPHGREIYTWTWMIRSPAEIREELQGSPTGRATGEESAARIRVEAANTVLDFDPQTGQLVSVRQGGNQISLANGPRIINGSADLTELRHYQDGDAYVVEADYDGNLNHVRWRVGGNGWVTLEYDYDNAGEHDFLGVTFDYPEDRVTGVRWLGQGPYRVWKNRMQGMTYDVWEKAYNDAITGSVWEYPEFKGYHANLHWAVLETSEAAITIVTDTEDLFLRLFTPRYTAEPWSGDAEDPRYTAAPFPDGDLSFLHGIAPIGTKFNEAADLGPEGLPNRAVGNTSIHHMGRYKGTLYFRFGAHE